MAVITLLVLELGGPQLFNFEAWPFTYDQYIVIELANKLYNYVTFFLCFMKVCLSHRSQLVTEHGLGTLQQTLWPDVCSNHLAIWTKTALVSFHVYEVPCWSVFFCNQTFPLKVNTLSNIEYSPWKLRQIGGLAWLLFLSKKLSKTFQVHKKPHIPDSRVKPCSLLGP